MVKFKRTKYFLPDTHGTKLINKLLFFRTREPRGLTCYDIAEGVERWHLKNTQPTTSIISYDSIWRTEFFDSKESSIVKVTQYDSIDCVKLQSFESTQELFRDKLKIESAQYYDNKFIGKNYIYDLKNHRLLPHKNYDHPSGRLHYSSEKYIIYNEVPDTVRIDKVSGEAVWSLDDFIIMGADENYIVGAYRCSYESICIFNHDAELLHIEDLPEEQKLSFHNRNFNYKNGVLSGISKGVGNGNGYYSFNVEQKKLHSIEVNWETFSTCVADDNFLYVMEMQNPRDYSKKAVYLKIYNYEMDLVESKKVGKKSFDIIGFHEDIIVIAEEYPNKKAREIILAQFDSKN